MGITIFWHHIGREHEIPYGSSIQRNNKQVVEAYLKKKEDLALASGHRYIRVDSHTLIELPREHDPFFIIVYDINKGIQYSFKYKDKSGWLIDIIDAIEVRENVYCIQDLFIDIYLSSDGTYQVQDLDEFYQAASLGVLSAEQSKQCLYKLNLVIEELENNVFPNPKLEKILATYSTWE
jgi:uncharacterized protein